MVGGLVESRVLMSVKTQAAQVAAIVSDVWEAVAGAPQGEAKVTLENWRKHISSGVKKGDRTVEGGMNNLQTITLSLVKNRIATLLKSKEVVLNCLHHLGEKLDG